MKRYIVGLVIAILPLLASADPSANYYHVREVHDGDSCKLYDPRDGVVFNVRLQGVDAPEIAPPPGVSRVRISPSDLSQPYAIESRNALASMVKDKYVSVDCSWGWSFNRRVCRLYLEGMNQTPLQDVGERLVLEGYAYAVDPIYEPPQAVAMAHHYGIWGLPHQEKPTEYRRRMREFQKAYTRSLELKPTRNLLHPWWNLSRIPKSD